MKRLNVDRELTFRLLFSHVEFVASIDLKNCEIMKKGGVREVNSFISVEPSGWARDSPVIKKPVTRTAISKYKTSTKNVSEIAKTAKLPLQKIDVEEKKGLKRSSSTTSRPTVKRESKSSTVAVTKPSAKTSAVSNSSAMANKNLRSSVAEEKRVISSHKTTLNAALKRKPSLLKSEKTSLHISAENERISKSELDVDITEANRETNKIDNADSDYDYEDDFEENGILEHRTRVPFPRTIANTNLPPYYRIEDYESTFESYSGSESNDSSHRDNETGMNYSENQKIIIEEEKKMDSGSYDLMYRKQIYKERNQLDIIREALQKENSSLLNVENSKENFNFTKHFLSSAVADDFNSTDLLLNFNAKSLQNFSNAKIKQRKSKTARMIRIRGQKLLEMISLDTMDYILYEQPSIAYEVFMRSFARQNTKQACTQTNEDAVSCEIQTEEITFRSKWTQYPVRISNNELKSTNLIQLLAGVGDENPDTMIDNEVPKINSRKLNHFMKTFGEEMIAVLEENLHETEIENANNTGEIATKISSYVSRIKYNSVSALKERPVMLLHYDPYDSSRLLTVHHKGNASQIDGYYNLLCVWNIYQPWKPKLMLKSYGDVSCACFVCSDSSHIVAGHDDGSICVWNLLENDAYSVEEADGCDDTHFRIKLPSYNTAEVMKSSNHKSRVVEVNAIRSEEKNPNIRKPETVYSIEEQNVLIVWTLATYTSQVSDIGSAPWSKIKFFVNQTIDIAQTLPKHIFRSTVAKILSEFHILLGTNAGYGLKFNLYSKKSKKYRSFGLTASNENKTKVTNLQVCPSNQLYFAMAFATGDIALFHTHYTEPVFEIFNDNLSSILTPITIQWLWNDHDYILVLDSQKKLKAYQFQSTNCTCLKIYDEELKDKIHSMIVSPCLPGQRKPNFVLLAEAEIQVHSVVSLNNLEDPSQNYS